jgi:hypothetical protein
MSKFKNRLKEDIKYSDPLDQKNKNIMKDYLLLKDSEKSGIMNTYNKNLKIEDDNYVKEYNEKLKNKNSNVENKNSNVENNQPQPRLHKLRDSTTYLISPWDNNVGGRKTKNKKQKTKNKKQKTKNKKQKTKNKKQRKTRKH